jgi:hypothetical protein
VSGPFITPAPLWSWRSTVLGLLLAGIAAVHQAVIAVTPTNDDFMHMALARQVLAGDWPLRDFFDIYGFLMYGVSAIAELLFGHRLLSEAVVAGVALAVSTYLVFSLVRTLTGSTLAAFLSAAMLIVAGSRGYSYPKMIIYAVAATLWWRYVTAATWQKALALGGWVAVAFYWRADHGVYVAMSVALAVVAAHGFSRIAAVRLGQAAAVSVVALLPLVLVASATLGFGAYAESGLTMWTAQQTTANTHTWPKWPLRRISDVIRLDGPEEFAPIVGLRWAEDSPAAARAAVLERYQLTPVASDGTSVQIVRLADQAPATIRDLINEPIVADTSGIDRSRSAIPWSTWPIWERLRFSYWWLRFRLFGGLNEQSAAAESVAAVFYLLPVIVIVAALPWLQRYLPADTTGPRLAAFGVFGVITAFGLMRSPYDVRAVDDVVVPAILFGCCLTALRRGAMAHRGVRRGVLAAATILFAVFVMKSVAVAGQFGDRVAWLGGEGRSLSRMQGAWGEVRDRLVAQPPLTYWEGKPMPVDVQLARYANECVPPSKRLLVLWFAPQVYYYADRLMASRHLFYESGYEQLVSEQKRTLEKIQRFAPPLVFATGQLDTFTRQAYPAIVDYIRREYETAGTVSDDGGQYQVLLRRNEHIVRSYGDQQWPCLT